MDHACNWPGCKGVISADKWGCEKCWNVLPAHIKQPILDALRLQDLGMFARASMAARQWVKYTFDGVDPRPFDPGKWERLKRWVRTRDEARAARRAAMPPELAPRLRSVP